MSTEPKFTVGQVRGLLQIERDDLAAQWESFYDGLQGLLEERGVRFPVGFRMPCRGCVEIAADDGEGPCEVCGEDRPARLRAEGGC